MSLNPGFRGLPPDRAPTGNAVKDICSRIRQNLDFFELDPNSGEFGYVDHPVFSSAQILHGVAQRGGPKG